VAFEIGFVIILSIDLEKKKKEKHIFNIKKDFPGQIFALTPKIKEIRICLKKK